VEAARAGDGQADVKVREATDAVTRLLRAGICTSIRRARPAMALPAPV